MNKKPTKFWSGRFNSAMNPDMESFSRSIDVDWRLWREDIAVNRGWAKALEKIKIYSEEELKEVQAGLDQIRTEFQNENFEFKPSDEDIHMAIERRLTEITGDAGAKIHTGRSRNDQVITDTFLYLKRELPELDSLLMQLQRVLIQKAEDSIDVVMPGYTHLQQAQPILLSHYLLSLFWPIQRDRRRLQQVLERCDVLPLGSGALAGCSFPIDRKEIARQLGFGQISQNSIDAVSDRDVLLDTVYSASMIMLHLSRYAEDLILWSGREFGFIELSDSFTTGSSMMPQKKNPDSLELIRGKTARVVGYMSTLQNLLKGLPLTYARDLQEDKPALFGAIDSTKSSVRIFTATLQEAKFHSEKMKQALDDLLLATDLADYLTRKGLPFRKAHYVVGQIVKKSIDSKTTLQKLDLASYRNYSELFDQDLYECLNIEVSLQARNIVGGTGPAAVRKQLEMVNEFLE